nr:MAG TPA: hypothetical protein [Caudoviricetes sp.]
MPLLSYKKKPISSPYVFSVFILPVESPLKLYPALKRIRPFSTKDNPYLLNKA